MDHRGFQTRQFEGDGRKNGKIIIIFDRIKLFLRILGDANFLAQNPPQLPANHIGCPPTCRTNHRNLPGSQLIF